MINYEPLKPVLNYLGSKASVAGDLARRMPPEALESRVEVFCGSTAVELALPRAKKNAILNDIDADVLGVAESIASDPQAVMSELSKLRSSRTTFNRIRDLRGHAEWVELTQAKRAAYMIYLSRESVNANMQSFSLSSKRRSSFKSDLDLSAYAERYEGVTFTNFDWQELLRRLVFKPTTVDLFLFADPPFVVSDGAKHYRHNFGKADHLLLARQLIRINEMNDGKKRNVKTMVTYDDSDYIRSLYREEFGWHIEEFEVAYDAGNRSRGKELIITNYDPNSSCLNDVSTSASTGECTSAKGRTER